MNKLSWILVIVAAATACKSSKRTQPGEGSQRAEPSTAWLDRLPSVESGAAQLSLQYAAGLVGIAADGSISVATPPAAAPTSDPLAGGKRVQLGELVAALGLPVVARRRDDVVASLPNADAGTATGEPPGFEHFAQLGHPLRASGAPAVPSRLSQAFGVVHEHDVTAGVIVFADANAPAVTLVDVVAQTGGFLAVRQGGELRALPLAFDRQSPPPIAPGSRWLEVRLGPSIEVESVPAKPTAVPALSQLGAAVTASRAADVLVAADTKVAELVAAVGQLRAAQVTALGFGRAPAAGSDAANARGEHGPRVIAWGIEPLDKPDDATAFRTAFDSALEPIRGCYEKALAKAPELAGTAQLQLSIAPAGTAAVTAQGVSVQLTSCVTAALKAVKFPTSANGVRALATLAFFSR